MTDYCSILLNPSTKSDILAACIQAAAASHAGHEQAIATGIAGLASIVTGFLAFAGGRYAYLAAVRQVRLSEEEAATRRRLFLQFFNTLIEDSIVEVQFYSGFVGGAPQLLAHQVKEFGLLPHTSSLIDLLLPKNWQSRVHAGDINLRPYVVLHMAQNLRLHWQTIISDINGISQPDLLLNLATTSLTKQTELLVIELRALRSTIR